MNKYTKWTLIGMGLYGVGWIGFFTLESISSSIMVISGLSIGLDSYSKVRRLRKKDIPLEESE